MSESRENIFGKFVTLPVRLRLIFVGWILFMVSLVCPAINLSHDEDLSNMQGYGCFYLSLIGFMMMPHLAFANSMMISTPFLVVQAVSSGRKLRLEAFVLAVAFVFTLTVPITFVPIESLMVGYYLWSLSFLITTIGLFYVQPTVG